MQRMSCPHCGYRNATTQNFCSRCEHSLHEPPETPAESDELKTQVDLRLSDFSMGEPAPRATGPTDLHANLLPKGPKVAGGELPLEERPTAPWPEGQSASSFAEEASKTAVEPWAQATMLLSAEEKKPRELDNWRARVPKFQADAARPTAAPEAPPPRIVQRQARVPEQRAPSERVREPDVPQPVAPKAAEGPKLAGRERPHPSSRQDRAAAQAHEVLRPVGDLQKKPLDAAAWPSPLRQLCALTIDLTLCAAGSTAVLLVLIALVPRAAWPAARPTLLEAVAMWLAHSGRAPAVWFVLSAALAALYGLWGATTGRTVGRLLCGLKLVDARGHIPGIGAGMWHILGGALGTGALGAGLLWPIVDPAARTWASLTSRTYVIRA